MDINNLLNQFLSGQNNEPSSPQSNNDQIGGSWLESGKNLAQKATEGGLGGFAGGAAAGGLLGLLLSSGKARQLAGNIAAYGGAAALGAMALKAYQNYQSNQGTAVASQPANNPSLPANQASFGLVLIKSMIMAAKVDGHIDATEQQNIFSAIEKSSLSTDEKAILLDSFKRPISLQEITDNINNPEQASQIYLASRIAINPDQAAEKEYLANLATALKLPTGLVSQLEAEVQQYSN